MKLAIRGGEVQIDPEDLAIVQGINWRVDEKGYAVGTLARAKVRMHRLIARTPAGLDTDHINGNRLDNRRANLRHCTKVENNTNRGTRTTNALGLKGVTRAKGRFRAQIQVRGQLHYLGLFKTPEEAHAAYCAAARKLHGEFCNLGRA